MATNALTFLFSLQNTLASLQPEHLADWRMRNTHDIDEELLRYEPFAKLANAWTFLGDGSGMVAQGICGSWVISQLVAGTAPKDIVSAFTKRLEINSLVVSEVTPVFGVSVDKKLELAEGVTLHPEAHGNWIRATADKPLGNSVLDAQAGCFLEQVFIVEPAFVKRSHLGEDPGESLTVPTYDQRILSQERVIAALLLASGNRVEMPSSTYVASDNELFGQLGIKRGSSFQWILPAAIETDTSKIAYYYRLVCDFGNREPIMLAVQRLYRSRSSIDPLAKILDLGIAAEVILMHDSKDGKGEITNKLGGRAAWLIGDTWQERIEISRDIRNLYHDRSAIVHNGRLSSPRVDASWADQLIQRIIIHLLERQSFPNWGELVLGKPSSEKLPD